MTAVLEHLRAARAAGRKLFVPYVMGGLPDRSGFAEVLAAIGGLADAIEIGLPYSDPVMDGPVIAAAASRALDGGAGPVGVLADLDPSAPGAPRLAMTYYNPIHRLGERAFCERAAAAGIAGLIVPDLPLEESAGLRAHAGALGLAWVPLVAPTTPPERVARLAETATGFVYAVSSLGTTGARADPVSPAAAVVERCRAATGLPVLVGIGISDPGQAAAAAAVADGVVVGSALVKALGDGGIDGLRALAGAFRAALGP